MIIIIAGAVLLLAAVGGGAFWYLSPAEVIEVAETDQASDEESIDDEYEEEYEEEESSIFGDSLEKAIYHRLRPTFITTFEANGKQRYMQTELTLVMRDSEVEEALTIHQPLVRHTLVLLFSAQDYLELQTPRGKRALKRSALEAVRKVLLRESGVKGLEKVLFTEFVMQ